MPDPTAASFLARIHAYRLLWWLALGVFTADQLTKLWVAATIPFGTWSPPGAITVIEGFFYITHVGNPGAAWSLFAGYSTALAVLAGVTLVAIYLGRRSLGLKQTQVQFSFGLLCGGIMGNLLDRLVHGHVIDFLDFHFGSYVYPTFNIADSGIVVGVFVYFIHSFRNPPPPAAK